MNTLLTFGMMLTLCILQTTAMHMARDRQQRRCTVMDIISCWFNPCRSQSCPFYPDAECTVVLLPCGCRAAWRTRWGEVNCDIPHRFQGQRDRQRATQPLINPVQPQQTLQVMGPPICPGDVRRVECRVNPCWRASCPSLPDAQCKPDYCGGCLALFYRDGMRVHCGRYSFPELIVPSSVKVGDTSAYTRTVNKALPPRILPNVNVNTGVSQELPPSIVTQPRHRASRPLSNQVPTDAARGVNTVSQETVPDNSGSKSILAVQQNVFGMGALFPTENSPSVSQSGGSGPLPVNTGSLGAQEPGVSNGQGASPVQVIPNTGVGISAGSISTAVGSNSENCPNGTLPVTCPDPCEIYSCPRYPNARCSWSRCGSCKEKWYNETGSEVSCHIPPPSAPCPIGEEPTCKCWYNHCPSDLKALCRVDGCGQECSVKYYKIVNNEFTYVNCHEYGKWTPS